MAPVRGCSGDGAGPSAHPISQPSTATAADAEEEAAEPGCSSNKLPGVADEDASLYLDLLRKARGDTALAGKWLEQISSTAPTGGGGSSSKDASAPPLPSSSSSSSQQQPRNPNLDLDAAAAAAGAPASFFCPISLKIMRDPVTLATGQSYDRPFIARWLAGGNASCPATGQALALPASQVPNVALRKATEDWAERHALWLLGPDGHVKPIPEGDDFSAAGVVRSYSNSGGGGGVDEALRLQAEALERHQREHRIGGGGGGGGGGGMLHGSPPSAPPLQGVPCNGGSGGSGGSGAPPPFYPPYYPRPLSPPGGAPPLSPRPLDHAQSACSLALNSPKLLSLMLYLCSGATLALFVVALWKNGWEVAPLRANPLIGASPAVLLQLGAKDGASIIDSGQWWRLFSSAFACAGALDAAVVSSLGWTLGFRAVARSVVAPAFSVPLIYLSSSVFGALVSVNALPKQPTPSVGAPAGCAGLLGAAVVLQLLHWRRFSRRFGTLVAFVGVGGVLAALAILPLNDCFYIGGGAAFGMLSAPVLANSNKGGGGGAAAARRRRRRNNNNNNEGNNANNSGEAIGGAPFSAAAFFSALFRLLLFCALAGALTAGVLGATKYGAALGERVCGERCVRAACVETRWWSCDGGGGGGSRSSSSAPAPVPPTGGATPACSAAVEGDSTKVTCASTVTATKKGGGETKTLQGRRATSGAGLIAVCREACLGGGSEGGPPAAAAPAPEQQQQQQPVQKVPTKDGVAADPSKGVLI